MKKNKNSRLHSYIDLLRSFKTKTIQTRFAQTVIVLDRFVQSRVPQHKKCGLAKKAHFQNQIGIIKMQKS